MSDQKKCKKFNRSMLLFIMVIIISFHSMHAQQPTLTWLGTLGGDCLPYALTADGSMVVGVSDNTSGSPRAFKWTLAGGMEDMGTLGGDWSEATGVSADGSIIVGWSWDNTVYRAFRWTQTNGMQDLGAGEWSRATGISADGMVVVGYHIPTNYELAFRWTAAGGLQYLGTLGGNNSAATAVSADGSVIVGRSKNTAGDPYAFRWTAGDSMAQIGTYYSFAQGVSGDGATVTGFETGSASFYRAFRWTLSGGFEFNIAGNFSEGKGISSDGSIIVGYFSGGAFRLSAAGGLEDLDQVYSNLLTAGSYLSNAMAISPNGRFITGSGYNAATGRDEGYLLDTEGVSSVSVSDLLPSRFEIEQNYPNPFNPVTYIRYSLPRAAQVKLEVYNSLGQQVADLVDGYIPAGSYVVKYDASPLPSGIYFYQLKSGQDFTEVRKMALLK